MDGSCKYELRNMRIPLLISHLQLKLFTSNPKSKKIFDLNKFPNVPDFSVHTYLLLTEFEGRTVSYGPSFFPPRFMAQARSARAINRRGKKRGSVTYSTNRENEVSKIFTISLVCVRGAQERFFFTERLQISDAPRKQNESI